MTNCYNFDGKLRTLYGMDKLSSSSLNTSWLHDFEGVIKKFLVEKNITETDDFDLNQIHNLVLLLKFHYNLRLMVLFLNKFLQYLQ